MERLFKDYKKHKDKVHAALIRAFRFLTKDQFKKFPDDPPDFQPDPGPPPPDVVVKRAKRHINRIAKKVWKS
jgi:hypothetical protein